MNFCNRLGGFPVITTARLSLREIRPSDDAPGRFAIWSDPLAMRYMPHRLSQSVDHSLAELRWFQEACYREQAISWTIARIDDDQLIGGIRYWQFFGHDRLNAEVGYELAPAYWGRGLMTEALTAVSEFGFSRLGLNRIQLTIHPDNSGSRKVAERSGFTAEGVLRRWVYNEQTHTWNDNVMYART